VEVLEISLYLVRSIQEFVDIGAVLAL
jgi:hypothetical protein